MPRARGLASIGLASASLLAAVAACSDASERPAGLANGAAARRNGASAQADPTPRDGDARASTAGEPFDLHRASSVGFDASIARPPQSWFPGRVGKLPAWGDEMRARLDPRRDGWASEAICPRLETELARALESALRRDPDLAPLRAIGTADLAVPRELVPAARAELLADAGTRVDEARDFPPAADLASALAGWRAALEVGAAPRCEVAIESWTPDGAGKVVAELAVRSSSPGATRVQATLALRTEWIASEGGARIARVEPVSATVVALQSPLIVDATEGVIGAEPWFASDVLIATDARHQRRDRLGIEPYLGMHGIAVGDVDGDGLEDLYVCQSSGLPNRLLLHAPDGTARDVAVAAGVAFLDGCSSAFFADLDGDGDEDLGVATGNALLLVWNDGRGRFVDGVVLRAPDSAEIYSIAAGDVDQDGDLDLYACRYAAGGIIGGAPAPYHDAHNGARNLFWRNQGARRFRECAAEVGLDAGNDRFSLAAVFEDLDDDGDADLYVTNDFGRNNLYANDGGHFTDVAAAAGAEDVAASMGAAIADLDQDGDLDVYVTNMESPTGSRVARSQRFLERRPADRPAYVRHARGNTLLCADGPLRYADHLESSGARRGGWAWGATACDWNSDGLPDVFVPNGFLSGARADDVESFFWRVLIASSPAAPGADEPYLHAWEFLRNATLVDGLSWNGFEPDDAYLNVGGGRFVDASRALGVDFAGDGRCAVRCDWDGDGREDLWVGARTGPRLRLLLAADARERRSVALTLVGTRSNRQGIGATVLVEAGGRTRRGAARVGDGFLSSSSKRVHVALGDATRVDAVRVRWPGGAVESFAGVEPGAHWRLVEGSGRAERVETARARPRTAAGTWPSTAAPALGRIVVDDRMPIGILDLARAGGEPRRVDSFDGTALVVAIGRASDPETAKLCDVLAARRADLGVATWTLAIADPGREEDARRFAVEHATDGQGGVLDARAGQALEVVLVEVLGPYERLPLPLALVVDRGGSLALIRCGPSREEAIVADVRAVASLSPDQRGTEPLAGGGRWARLSERALGPVGDVFERLGRPAWAAWFRERARTRTAR